MAKSPIEHPMRQFSVLNEALFQIVLSLHEIEDVEGADMAMDKLPLSESRYEGYDESPACNTFVAT